MPKVSVIIPVYNAQAYLERCLDSIVNQTLKDIEIICVDDCSTDNSVEILEKYASADSRIKVIKRTENGGESRARNAGLENVTGEYLAFVDNDYTIDLNFLEKLYTKAKEENADIARGEADYIDYSGKSYKDKNSTLRTKINKLYFSGEWWCAIYKTSLIKRNNIILPEELVIGGDLVFLFNALLAAAGVAVAEGVYYHHFGRRDSNASETYSDEKVLSMIQTAEIIITALHENNIDKVNADGYDWTYKKQFEFLLGLNFCSKNSHIVMNYTQKILDLYFRCRRKIPFENFLDNDYTSIALFIKTRNLEGLNNYLLQNRNRKTFIVNNLRAKIKRQNNEQDNSNISIVR